MTLRTFASGLICASMIYACSGHNDCGSRSFYTPVPEDCKTVSFDLDMSDSSCVYSITLDSRFDRKFSHTSTPLHVEAISPSGKKGHEYITLPSDYNSIKNYTGSSDDRRIGTAGTSGYYDISWKYRDNICPDEKGIWKISVTVPDTVTGITGIGLTLDKIPLAEQ